MPETPDFEQIAREIDRVVTEYDRTTLDLPDPVPVIIDALRQVWNARPSTIWVIEQGEYSDYGVLGVFSSKENAQQIADMINGGDVYSKAEIAEWPLDPVVNELRMGYLQYFVRMLRDGTVETIEHRKDFGIDGTGGAVWIHRRSTAPVNAGKNVPDALYATVWAKDDTHAIKIVNEHRTQLIASGAWD